MNNFVRRLKDMSIKLKLWLIALVMMMSVVLITLLAIIIPYRVNMETSLYNNQYSRQAAIESGIVSTFNEVNFLHSRLMIDSGFISLSGADNSGFSEIIDRMGINHELIKETAYFKDKNPEKTLTYSSVIPLEQEDYDFADSVFDGNKLIYEGPVKKIAGNNYLMLGKRINRPYADVTECIIYYIDLSYISALCNTGSDELGDTLILSGSDTIITDTNPSLIGGKINLNINFGRRAHKTMKYNDIRSILISSPLSVIGSRFSVEWTLVSVVPYNQFYADINTMVLIFSVAGLIILIITSFVFLKIMGVVTAPIVQMSANIRKYGKDGRVEPIPLEYKGNELNELQSSYDDMLLRIKKLIEKNNYEMEVQRKLELDALQAQINPHFLYNTLDAIAWLAKLKKQPEIENMVMSLAAFFRISLHNGDKYITVNEEIALVQSYIKMENIRHPERFLIIYDTDEKAGDLLVLKLILQPLVENAFKHGFVSGQRGRLIVSSRIDGSRLIMSVKDDGPGFIPDSNATGEPALSKGGYGLKNIRERLLLEYGGSAELIVKSAPGEGAETSIIIELSAIGKTSGTV